MILATMIDPAPLFSIITITKENLEGLRHTAQSVQGQSSNHYEWIVVDGDSKDGTMDFLKTLKAVTISEPDRGLYHAMNKGIDRARGAYLIFMNAGDSFADPDILSTLVKAIQTFRPDFLYGDALEDNGFYKKARSHRAIKLGMFTHHQAMVYKKDVIGELRYDETYKIAADYDFTARVLKRCQNPHYIPCAICYFAAGGISQRSMTLGRREQFTARQRLNLCPPWNNLLIYMKQKLAGELRVAAPGFYSKIRQK